MKLTEWFPYTPPITSRIITDLDRLQRNFKRQHGQWPQHAAIWLGLDDKNVRSALLDWGLPTQTWLWVDQTRYVITAARQRERQIQRQRIKVIENIWRVRAAISKYGYGHEVIAWLLNFEPEALRRLIDAKEPRIAFSADSRRAKVAA